MSFEGVIPIVKARGPRRIRKEVSMGMKIANYYEFNADSTPSHKKKEEVMNERITNYRVVMDAIDFAVKAHEGQVRKGTDLPYVTHPIAVGTILAGFGCSADLVVAGILHDCIEDADVTFDDIAKRFNYVVAEIVRNCSEPDKKAPWRTRKEHTIAHLKSTDDDACIVACADKLNNLLSNIRDYKVLGEALWDRFRAGKKEQIWYYSSLGQSFEGREMQHLIYKDYSACLSEFLQLIKG